MNIRRSLVIFVFISLVAEKASCQTQSLYFKAWTHPVLKLLEKGAPGIIALTHEREDDYLIPLVIVNKGTSMLYYINTFGSVFDSIGAGPLLIQELVSKKLNAFDFYRKNLTADELKEIEDLRSLIRAGKDITKNIAPGKTYIDYSALGNTSSSLEQMILLDNIERTVLQNLILANLVLRDNASTGFKEKRDNWDSFEPCKIRKHSGTELDSVEFTSTSRYTSLSRAILKPATATIYLYDQLNLPVDSFAIKKDKVNELFEEKQDVFALYRNWLEWQLQLAEDGAKRITVKKEMVSAAKNQTGGTMLRKKMLLEYASYIRQKIRYCIAPDKDLLLINILKVCKQQGRKKWVAAKRQWENVVIPAAEQNDPSVHTFTRGNTEYFLTDHRSNVMVTVSDRKLAVDSNHDGTIDYYVADVISATDYAPFGSQLTGRTYRNHDQQQRYGYNGKENDNDIKGEGNQQDYGMRVYDPRLGRFLSVDPIGYVFPWNSTYAFAENDVIRNIDLDGLEKVNPQQIEFAKKWMKWHEQNYISTKNLLDKTTDKEVRANLQKCMDQSKESYAKLVKFVHENKLTDIEVANFYLEKGIEAGKVIADQTPIGDAKVLVTGNNFQGQKKSRILAAGFLVLDIFGGEIVSFAGHAGKTTLTTLAKGLKYAEKYGKCVEFVAAFTSKFGRVFKTAGVQMEVFEINIGGKGLIGTAETKVADNGMHQFVEVTHNGQSWIIDNMHPEGMLKEQYIEKIAGKTADGKIIEGKELFEKYTKRKEK